MLAEKKLADVQSMLNQACTFFCHQNLNKQNVWCVKQLHDVKKFYDTALNYYYLNFKLSNNKILWTDHGDVCIVWVFSTMK